MRQRAILAFALLGCSTTATTHPCTPGAVASCACLGGAQGVQTCETSSSFGACVCPDAGGAADVPAVIDTPDVPAVVDATAVVDTPDVPAVIDVPVVIDTPDVPTVVDAPALIDMPDVPAVVDVPCADGTACGSACVDTQRDPRNCGRCGNDCAALTGVVADRARCVAGVCDVTEACLPSRAHCTASPGDGCETDVTTPDRCGACGARCADPSPYCSLLVDSAGGRRYACVSDCRSAAPARCGNACVDPSTDPRHCGRCGNACPGAANASAACASGTCSLRCDAGHHDCGGACVPNGAPGSCGARCSPCPAATNATATCDGAACGFTCNTGFADCNGVAADGCEVDVRTSNAHCGRCASVCAAGTACSSGSCASVCAAPTSYCAGGCVNLATNPSSCGGCGVSCPERANSTRTCAGGACGFTCNAGYVRSGDACVLATPDGVADPVSSASAVTLLRDPTSGAPVVVYRDDANSTRNDVRLARFVGGAWTTTTLYSDAVIVKQGAGIDPSGRLHLAVQRTGMSGIHYGTDRSGAWSALTPIPGMPGGDPTLDVDDAGAVHVTSNTHLNARYYTHNASGSWLASPPLVASSASAPASIIAAGLSSPAMTYADWGGHTVYFAQSPSWPSRAAVASYGVDQGPPQSLKAFGGSFYAAYIFTTDSYTRYSLFFQSRPSGGSWSGSTTLLSDLPAFSSVEVVVDEGGVLYVASCAGNVARVHTNRGSGWTLSTPSVPACVHSLDAIAFGGRLYLAYRGSTGRLTVASVATSTL